MRLWLYLHYNLFILFYLIGEDYPGHLHLTHIHQFLKLFVTSWFCVWVKHLHVTWKLRMNEHIYRARRDWSLSDLHLLISLVFYIYSTKMRKCIHNCDMAGPFRHQIYCCRCTRSRLKRLVFIESAWEATVIEEWQWNFDFLSLDSIADKLNGKLGRRTHSDELFEGRDARIHRKKRILFIHRIITLNGRNFVLWMVRGKLGI